MVWGHLLAMQNALIWMDMHSYRQRNGDRRQHPLNISVLAQGTQKLNSTCSLPSWAPPSEKPIHVNGLQIHTQNLWESQFHIHCNMYHILTRPCNTVHTSPHTEHQAPSLHRWKGWSLRTRSLKLSQENTKRKMTVQGALCINGIPEGLHVQ